MYTLTSITRIKNLANSEKLCLKYGEGWSYSNLRQIRQFYLVYANLTDSVCQIQFDLSWSHYIVLMRIMLQLTNSIFPTRPCCKPRLKNGLRSLKKMRS